MLSPVVLLIAIAVVISSGHADAGEPPNDALPPRFVNEVQPLYLYSITASGTPASYDEAMAVASLQGIINRKSPEVYLLSHQNSRPQYWLDLLAKDSRWLHGREQKRLADI